MSKTNRKKILLCGIAKNEGPYLAEWAVYHKMIGFDDIVVYENESTDDSREVLEALEVNGVLRWKQWPSTGDGRVQKAAYADCLMKAKDDFEWIAFLDIDEFLYIPKFGNSVLKFLEAYEHLDAIGVNWSLFGTSNHVRRTDGLVIERFTRRAQTKHSGNRAVKTIAKTDSITAPNLHNHVFKEGVVYQTVHGEPVPAGQGKSTTVSHDVIRVNHYFTKSEEEWQLKVSRGRATKPDGHPDKLRTKDHFDRHNRNEVVSSEMASSVQPVLDGLRKLGFKRPTMSQTKPVSNEESPSSSKGLAKLSYSQFAEDLILETLLKRSKIGLRPRGFYLDIGACWPIKYSNTYLFYKMGWSGLCLDPRPGFEVAFSVERPRDTCVNVGVGSDESVLTYYAFENPVFNTFEKARADRLIAMNKTGRNLIATHEVQVQRLQSVIDQNWPEGVDIDFASIDVEGFEMSVVRSLDLSKNKPHVMVIEAKARSIEASLKSEIALYLKAYQYRYVAATDQNMFFSL